MYQIDFLVHEFDLNLEVTRHRENLLEIQVHITRGYDNTK